MSDKVKKSLIGLVILIASYIPTYIGVHTEHGGVQFWSIGIAIVLFFWGVILISSNY